MMQSKPSPLLQCPMGSVFSPFGQEDLESISHPGSRKIAISGKINRPGIYEVPEGATLSQILAAAGGIVNNHHLKAAQFGMPLGHFVTDDTLPIAMQWFPEGALHAVIILSDEDCIVQYARYYLDFLQCKQSLGLCCGCPATDRELAQMQELFDRIAKGRAQKSDLFRLRQIVHGYPETGQWKPVISGILEHFYEELTAHIDGGRCPASQCSHLIKLTITAKCVGCNRCQSVCPVDCIRGYAKEQHEIDYVRCTHCGSCVSVCPVSAITSGNNTMLFLRDLASPGKTVITQMAPSVRVTIGEAFGFSEGENVQNKIAAALKLLGVDFVFDTTWAADLTVMEEAAEFADRLTRYNSGDKTVKLPILTSCCPAWIKFIEQNYGDLLDIPSTAKSPMEMFGAAAKNIWAAERGIPREKLVCAAIMPCIAKKYEASRPEFSSGLNYDVDYVITASELIDLLKSNHIDLKALPDAPIDPIMGQYTGGGVLFGRTGGVIEAVVRVAVQTLTGKPPASMEFTCLHGWDSVRTCEVPVGAHTLRIGIAHGLREAGKLLDKIRAGEDFYHAIEIMACAGGCVGGGGQPKSKGKRQEVLQCRMDGLDAIDRAKMLRASNENPQVMALYRRYFGQPLSPAAEELLHTRYFIRRNY